MLCSACSTAPPPRRDVVVGIVGEPAGVLADEPGARVIAGAVVESLVRRDARDEYVPRLAQEVPTFENGGLRLVTDGEPAEARLVATYRLRSGLTWHDGRPLTGEDVRFAWEEGLRAPEGSEDRRLAERVERVDVIDDRIVRLVHQPGERWDAYPLAARALPRHLLEGATAEEWNAYRRVPVHAGPFTVAAWVAGFGVTLAAFTGYALGPPAVTRIEVRFLRDRAAVLDALRRGEIDVAPAPALEADLARLVDSFADGSERARLQAYYTAAESLEVLHVGPLFAEPMLRRALELSLDRPRIVETILAGRARVPRSYLAPPLWAHVDVGAPLATDRESARSLFATAGFHKGDFGILERGGDRLIVTLLVGVGSVARLDSAHMVAGDLAAVGIAATVVERPLAEVQDSVASGRFDLALAPESAADPLFASDRYRGRVDGWFDTLSVAAHRAAERADRRLLYGELQRLWADRFPGLPLYQHLRLDVARRELIGIQPTPHDEPVTWNAADWRFEAR